MAVRGVRGAITVKKNSKDEIVFATEMLLEKIVSVNNIKVEDIAAVTFSVTHDLTKEFPAIAAREMGWLYTPLMCTNEIQVEGSLKRCIRVLMLVNSDKKQSKVKHIYLNEAKKLRPDLSDTKKGKYYIS